MSLSVYIINHERIRTSSVSRMEKYWLTIFHILSISALWNWIMTREKIDFNQSITIDLLRQDLLYKSCFFFFYVRQEKLFKFLIINFSRLKDKTKFEKHYWQFHSYSRLFITRFNYVFKYVSYFCNILKYSARGWYCENSIVR